MQATIVKELTFKSVKNKLIKIKIGSLILVNLKDGTAEFKDLIFDISRDEYQLLQ